MTIWEAAILGLVQGLTEFLPISSSGHLVLAQNIMGIESNLLFFDVMLHLSTLAAVIAAFYKDIIKLFQKPWDKLFYLFLATIPAGAVMLILKAQIAFLFTGQYLWIGFLISAVILLTADFFARKKRTLRPIDAKTALLMGLGQAVAVVPGISRSGATISAGIIYGAEKNEAARFSFLMSIPIILGSVVLEASQMSSWQSVPISSITVGMIAALLSGFFAIRFFLKIVRAGKFRWFYIYLLLLSIFVMLNDFVFHIW